MIQNSVHPCRTRTMKTIKYFIEIYEKFTSEELNVNGQRHLRAVRFKLH